MPADTLSLSLTAVKMVPSVMTAQQSVNPFQIAHIFPVADPCVLLLSICSAVFLAGLASLQQICNDATTQYGNQGGAPGGAGAGGTGNPNSLQQIQGQSLNTAGLLNVFGKCVDLGT